MNHSGPSSAPLAAAAAVVVFSSICWGVPGLYQRSFSGSFNTTGDPSVGGTVVPGALLASTHTSSYTYNGTIYSMGGNTTFAYKGFMFFKGGVTYYFVKRYDDSGLIRITQPDGTVRTPISSNSYNQWTVYGSYTPSVDGWHGIDLRVGNGSGGMGPDVSPFNQADKLAAGLAWNTNGLATCTDDNYTSWRKFLNTEDDIFLYTLNPSFDVTPADRILVDGIHPVLPPKVAATNLLTGAGLTEGVDYDVIWPDVLLAPGSYTYTVTGRADTVCANARLTLTTTVCLTTDAKRPRLPDGFVETEWIASSQIRSSKQYINTKFVPTKATRVECVCTVPRSTNTEQYEAIFGSRSSYPAAFTYFVKYNGYQVAYGRGGETPGGTFIYDKKVTVIAHEQFSSVSDGATTYEHFVTTTPTACGTSMAVFNLNTASAATGCTPDTSNIAMTLYSFKMSEGNVQYCNLVPCYRVSDGAVGAYDVAQLASGASAFCGMLGGTTAFTKSMDLIRPHVNDRELDFFATATEHANVSYIYSINTNDYVGAAATVEWSTNADFSNAQSASLGSSAAYAVDTTGIVNGLSANTTYYFRLTLAKAGQPDLVRTFSYKTLTEAGGIAPDFDLSWTSGVDPKLTGAITAFGSGSTHTVKVMVGESTDNMVECGMLDVTETGNFTVTFRWPFYYKTAYYKLVYVTDTGTSESDIKSMTPTYTATYTWKNTVTEGDWTNGNNWTVGSCSVLNPTETYPQRLSYQTAAFPAMTAKVHLTGNVECKCVQPATGARVTLVGNDATTSYVKGSMLMTSSNAHMILDNVAYYFTGSLGSAQDHIAASSLIRLQNGASLTNSTGYFPQYFNGLNCALELAGKSAYMITSASVTWVINGGHVLNDDSTFSAVNAIDLGYSDAAPTWTFAGASPLLKTTSTCTVGGAGGAKLVFDAPKGGYMAAPINVPNNVFLSTCAGPVEISVPQTAEVWHGDYCSFDLLSAPKGINTNNVTLATPLRKSGAFVWTQSDGIVNPTGLKFVFTALGTTVRFK